MPSVDFVHRVTTTSEKGFRRHVPTYFRVTGEDDDQAMVRNHGRVGALAAAGAGHGGHDPGCLGANSQEKHIALAIALSLPAEVPGRDTLFIPLAMGAVLFTLLVQGLTIRRVLSKFI